MFEMNVVWFALSKQERALLPARVHMTLHLSLTPVSACSNPIHGAVQQSGLLLR